MNWIQQIRNDLASIDNDHLDEEAKAFLPCYQQHQPVLVPLPPWKAFNWSFDLLRQKAGEELVQVQTKRNLDPDYEFHSERRRDKMTFSAFLDAVEFGAANDVYMTAQNRAENASFMAHFIDDLTPLPSYLTNAPQDGFLWFGRETLTPFHHDLTNNFMSQIMGEKLVRVVSPEQWDKCDHRQGVHSHISWLSNEIAEQRGIEFHDFLLRPGIGLLLPVGWLHCVRTTAISISCVFTNFIWRNDAYATFPF